MATQPEHSGLGPPPREATPADTRAASSASHALAHDHQLRHRVLRIRITDVETGRLKVGLTLPAGLVPVALRQGARLLPPGQTDLDLVAAIENNDLQSPLIVEDAENGERVEISLA